MDTEQFLNAVLPQTGQRCISANMPQGFRNFFFASNAEAADAILKSDSAGTETYFACASYVTPTNRTQANVAAVKSFWLDIDTRAGKDGPKYADQADATNHVIAFSRALGVKIPWLLDSGYGLHVYWALNEAITPAQWQATADLLKVATKSWGLDADPTRTADSASLLRPVGTHNRKRDGSKTVKLLRKGNQITHAEFRAALEAYTGSAAAEPDDIQGTRPRAADIFGSDSSGLKWKPEYPPSDAGKIADGCKIIGEMRATRGNMDEPTWYSSICVLAHTTQGADICHEWSTGHKDYSHSETQAKIEQALRFGPVSCVKLGEARPSVCAACPHRGHITSPISLGADNSSVGKQPIPVEPAEACEPAHTGNVASGAPTLPYGYRYGLMNPGDKYPSLYKIVKSQGTDDEGNPLPDERKFIVDFLLYASARIGSSDDLFSMNMVMKDNRGNKREFVLDHGKVAEGGQSLFGELGRREVNVSAAARPLMADYLSRWIGELRDNYIRTPSIDQFGWHDNGFVVGTNMVVPGGEVRKAVLQGPAARLGEYLKPTGALEPWIAAVDRAYNHPGDEPLQFCVLMAFAAPLWSMFGEVGGVSVYANSAGSGYGKSTAQMVGLSAWGHPPEISMRDGKFTSIGLYDFIGALRNLPIVIDEFTNARKEFASDLVYSMSAGQGRVRMTRDITLRKTMNWSTIMSMSGNVPITEKLALHRADASAEMMRVWEFSVTKKSTIDPNTALTLFETFQKNYGHAGLKFAHYIVDNRDAVKQRLYDLRQKLNNLFGITQAERYWSALFACAMTALEITQKLELLRFDSTRMVRWIGSTLDLNRGQVVQNVSTPLEQFADMLADLSTGMIVTEGAGDIINGAPAPVIRFPHGPVTGRVINADRTSRAEMYISVNAAKNWCLEHNVSFKDIDAALAQAGWAEPKISRRVLGKGTDKFADQQGAVRCWVIRPHVIENATSNIPEARKVRRVIQSSDATGDVSATG